MLRLQDDIHVESNFLARLIDPVTRREVKGSRREAHNVFTATGRDWLAHLIVWSGIGTGLGGADEAVTQRRLRWIGVGTGTQAEVEGVTALDTPVKVDSADNYLAAIQSHEFHATKQVRVYKEFATTEISTAADSTVAVTEAGLFVDVVPVSTEGGVDDSAVGAENSTLNRLVQYNSPVAYKTFGVITKTQDFNLEIRWELRF